MRDPVESLNGPQSQALRSTCVEVLDFVERARGILDAQRAADFPILTPEAAAEIERRIAELEADAGRLMTRFRLAPAERNVRGELRAYGSRIWADLLDCRSRPMRRYGRPPDWYAERLDPVVEKMAALAHEIVYFARERQSE